jgi:hypothetical protein
VFLNKLFGSVNCLVHAFDCLLDHASRNSLNSLGD